GNRDHLVSPRFSFSCTALRRETRSRAPFKTRTFDGREIRQPRGLNSARPGVAKPRGHHQGQVFTKVRPAVSGSEHELLPTIDVERCAGQCSVAHDVNG